MSFVSQFISRLVIAGEILPDDYRCKPEYFREFAKEWEYLLDYHSRLKSLPNEAAFVKEFPDFVFTQTQENAQWLLDQVDNDYLGRMVVDCVDTTREIAETNAVEAVKYLDQEVKATLFPLIASSRLRHSIEHEAIPDVAQWRAEMAKITTGVPTGFALLDEVTFGTQPGEIEIWFGRTGEGKSLMLMHGAIAARHAGVTVSYISPEMTIRENRIRYDAMTTHVSASGLFSGNLTDDEYNQYIQRKQEYDELAQREFPPFYMRDSYDHAGRFTTADIAQIIKEDQPGLVIIDGLMLIEPVKQDKNMDIRKRIIATMEELKTIATNTNVPIRLAHQASRESDVKAKRKKKTYSIDDVIPEMSHLAESSSVEQFANKIIAIKQWCGLTYLALRKNRNGRFPRVMQFLHDIDTGVMWDMRLVQLDPKQPDASVVDPPKTDISRFPDMPF